MATSDIYSPHIHCMWLDASVNQAGDSEKMQRKLCDIFGRCAFVETLEKGRESIKRTSGESKLLLIVSGQIGSQLVPSIHDEKKIRAIYVYCGNVENHIGWSKPYSKVKLVTSNPNQLLEQLRTDKPNL